MAIFIFKMLPSRHLEFLNWIFFWSMGFSIPNFIEIGQMVFDISCFFGFSRWQPSAILDLFGAYLDLLRNLVVFITV